MRADIKWSGILPILITIGLIGPQSKASTDMKFFFEDGSKIVATKTFTGDGFTFEYPVFDSMPDIDIQTEGGSPKAYEIRMSKANYKLLTIRIYIGKGALFVLSSGKQNPQKVPYLYLAKDEELHFMSGEGPARVILF
jgi:hypothetical protein